MLRRLASPALAGYEEAPADSHPEPRWLLPMDGPLGSPFGCALGAACTTASTSRAGPRRASARPATASSRTSAGSKDYSGYGLVIKVRHEDGIVTMYAHLSRRLRQARRRRRPRGQIIARAGCTGSCTGVHLHFQAWRDGKLIDPLRFLGRHAFDR